MRLTKPIDWAKTLAEIEDAMTEHEAPICAKLECSHYIIRSLKNGTKKEPGFTLGCDIMQLHRLKTKKKDAPLYGKQRCSHDYIMKEMTCQV